MSRHRPDGSRNRPIRDWHLWTEVTRSVSPLRPPEAAPVVKQVVQGAKNPPGLPQRPPVEQGSAFERLVRNPQSLFQGAGAGQPGFSPRTRPPGAAMDRSIEPGLRRRVARGRLEIDATLDLHGLRQSQAHGALCRFIEHVWSRGDRTVLIITGKGVKRTGFAAFEQKGVLRHAVPVWLAEPALSARVAGWGPSAIGHGGDGALYVRLKTNTGAGRGR
jgi:DNA-nicking Smr family endonuclease